LTKKKRDERVERETIRFRGGNKKKFFILV